MDLTGVRSESHVAQQSRREKLRVQKINSTQSRRTDYLHHHSDEQQIPLHAEFSPDLVQVRSVRNANSLFDQTFLPSEMTCFSSDFNALSSQRDSIVRPQVSENPLPHSSSHSTSCNLNVSSKVHQQASDWILNYGNNPWSAENNQNPTFSGEVANGSVPQPYLRPSYSQDCSFSSDNLPEQDRRKNAGESQFITLPFQNTLLDVVSPASIRTPVTVSGQAGWASATELESFPSFRNQEDLFRFENSMNWVDRSAENSAQQGLSLSLSANPPSKSPASQLEDGRGSEDLQQTNGIFKDHNDSVSGKSGCLRSISKPSAISKGCGKSIQEMIGVSSNTCRNTGPLGPFTGYAIILKSSKFLKPAQQVLEEICGKSRLSSGKTCDVSETASVDVFNTTQTETLAKDYDLSASSSAFYGSSETIQVNHRSSIFQSVRPDVQQKKAKLVHIMEEVCRRYRQYNQQMQMVVSSFESVAGLGSATPFMSTVLKTVSREFRCLKDVISDQLRHTRQGLREELLLQVTETSGVKVGGSCANIRGDEQSSEKYGHGLGGFGLLQPNQHLWRPQRGLPERAVGVLRAWLFDNFLHPYPTDADKHMLATQTGLSRNQVSNWFINARVRVWKPMVEEIHMLETKASNDANPNQTKDPQNNKESCSLREGDHQKQPGLDEDPSMGQKEGTNENQWWSGHEKRPRLESEASPSSFEGPLVGFMPYRRSQLGGVSLTLGLRHGVENSQQQIVLEHQNQLRRQCGEHYVRDFVG